MEYVEPIRDKKKIDLVKNILKKQSNRNFLLFLIGINCGLRISDILKLQVKDVKDKKYIDIVEQKTGKHKKVLITNSFKVNLINYIKNKDDDEYIFRSKSRNTPISRVQAYRIIHKACLEAGIQDAIGTHTLRKTFGYHFYNKTKDIVLLQCIFNHSSPRVTLRYVGINQDIIDKKLKEFSL